MCVYLVLPHLQNTRKKVIERMQANIGIDVGKQKCDYCIVDEKGSVVEGGQYPNTILDAKKCAQALAARYLKKGSCQAACGSAANLWAATYDAFEDAGIKIKLANTFEMSVISKADKKTDKVDAQKIANILRMDMIPECHVPSKEIRDIRNMVRHQATMMRDRTHVTNRVHGMLEGCGLSVRDADMYSQQGIAHLEDIVLPTLHETQILQQCVRQIKYLTECITEMEKELDAVAAHNNDARLLASMPGVGPFIALLVAVEIDDASRFSSSKKLVSMAGFSPMAKRQPGMDHMKKPYFNKVVNWAIREAANVAIQSDPKMAAAYESARRRHAGEHSPGITVVGNKMVTIMWHMLRTQTPYESRNQELYERKLDRMDRARHQKR